MGFTDNLGGGMLSPGPAPQSLGTWTASNVPASLTDDATRAIFLGGWYAVAIPFHCSIVGFAFAMKGATGATGQLTMTPWINGADPGSAYDAVFQNQSTGTDNKAFYVPLASSLAVKAGNATVPGDTFQIALTTTSDWDSVTADFAWSPIIIPSGG